MTRFSILALSLAFLGLNGCASITPAPDYAVKVAPAADGKGYAAIPPACPAWSSDNLNFFDNQPMPQFGCADARNFAIMVDQPGDLLQGRPSGPASGVTTAGAVLRYQNNQTRGLLYVAPQSDSSADVTTAPAAASSLTGETPSSSSGASLGK